MNYYINILFSQSANKYYVGYSPNPEKRLLVHNSYENKSKFTAKYQSWELKAQFIVSQNLGEALKVERFVKRQKESPFPRRSNRESSKQRLYQPSS
ncbi:GIY-YIG nuclease family protein [Carboxylicivirga marina]|uniref:GIY-YIG nuclease family protein n=1 Tax=Carboxylicivirga marina TaxID=2800988 RepID=A0ABS1HE17_9BACT|nr:GIY-YIG nuclease family protein [Carboxylicivirga marina]MBK3515912.1 GIY-YIG nuclease family protein [Carboxylicivirga marina]